MKRKTEKTRNTERQKDRKTERQKDRKTERQKDRKTERQKDRKTERQKDRKTDRQIEVKVFVIRSLAFDLFCSSSCFLTNKIVMVLQPRTVLIGLISFFLVRIL